MNVPHVGFILAAYAITALTLVGMIGALVLDHRALRRDLARMRDREPS